MAEEKQHDWLVSTLNQPDFTLEDYNDIGLSKDNTEFKDRDFYKSKDYFRNQFQTAEGEFDEVEFDKFYDQSSKMFSAYNAIKEQGRFIDNIEVGFDNIFVNPEIQRTSDRFDLKKIKNPWRSKIGLSGLNQVTDSGFSAIELAQDNFLRDADGNKLDITANDLGAFKTIFNKDTYVLDTWDEDGFHENEYGRRVKHKKGDTKLDEEGAPYLRALRLDEDVSQKRVLNWTDVVTTDGSYWNKWDFFDNDGKEQNITKSIVRGALKVAPLTLGLVGAAPVATAYAGITAALSFAQSLPSISKALDGMFNKNGEGDKRNDLWKGMNALEGFASRFEGSTSEYAQQNAFAFENILSMITDVGMQLQQQKFISNIPRWLGAEKKMVDSAGYAQKQAELFTKIKLQSLVDPTLNTEKAFNIGLKELAAMQGKKIENYQNLVKGLSSTYMAITSVGDAWAGAISDGHDERTAGIITMGTLAGLYSLMRYTDVGQWALNNMGMSEVRAGLKQGVTKGLEELGEAYTRKGLSGTTKEIAEKNLFNKFKRISSDFVDKLRNRPSDFMQELSTGALAEGIEEMTEEGISDAINVMANIGMFGKTDGHHEFTMKDIATRYAMSFLGGMAGGAIHVGLERIGSKGTHDALDKSSREELQYLTYKYGADVVKEEIEKRYKKGILPVDKVLSITNFEKDADGNVVQKIAETEQDTAGWQIKERLKEVVDTYASMLRGVTEDSFDNDIDRALRGDEKLSKIMEISRITPIKDDYMKAVSKYIDAKFELQSLDGNETNEQVQRLKDAASEIEKFKNGEYFDYYAEMGTFIMDEELSNSFIASNKYTYAAQMYNKPYDELSAEEKNKVDSEFEEYSKFERGIQTKKAFDYFKKINEKFSASIGQKFKDFAKVRKVTSEELVDFDKALERLKFDEAELVKLEQERKDFGIADELKIAEIKNNTKQNILNIQQALAKYTNGIDSYVAGMLLDKLNVYRQTTDLTADKFRSILEADMSKSIFKDSGNLPKALEAIFKIRPHEFDVNKINSEIDKLQNTDPTAEGYIDLSFLNDYNQDALDNYLTLSGKDLNNGESVGGYSNFSEYTGAIDIFKDYLKFYSDNTKVEIISQSDIENSALLSQIEEQLQNQQVNPLYDMLDELGKMSVLNYSGALNVLREENARYKDAGNITDYIIDNNLRLQELQQIKDNAVIIKSLMRAAKTYDYDGDSFGYNQFANNIKKKFGQDSNLLEIISDADEQVVLRDLEILENKIDYLLQLSRYNDGDKLRAHKKTALKIQYLQHQGMMDVIKSIRGNTSLPQEFIQEMVKGFDQLALDNDSHFLDSTANKMLSSFDVSDDTTMARFETIVTKYENLLYDNYQNYLKKKPANVDEAKIIHDIFAPLYNNDSLHDEQTSEMAESTDALTDYDKMNYFVTSMSIKSSNVKHLIKELLDSGEFKYAPVYAQEYAAKMAIASVLNPKLYNAANKYVQTIATKISGGSGQVIGVNNLMYIKGYHGSGKTTATLNLIEAFLKKFNIKTTATSIIDSQVENIKKSLGREEGFTKQQLMAMLNASDLSTYVKPPRDLKPEIQSLINPLIPKNGVDPTPNIGRVIYIDEVTHYTAFELKFLSMFAEATGRSLVVFGDRLQEGALYNGSDNNIEWVYKSLTPMLEFSMRANNIHVKDNNNKVRAASLRVMLDKYGNVNSSKIDENYLKSLANIEFTYSEKDDQFHGNKVVDGITKEDIDYLIKVNKDGKIGFIYDNENSPIYKLISGLISTGYADSIKMYKRTEVQGLEMDHFIIDVDFKFNSGESLEHSRLLNTVLSRSRHGSLIVKNGLTVSSKDLGYTRTTEIKTEESDKFKDSRIAILDHVLQNAPADLDFISQQAAPDPAAAAAGGNPSGGGGAGAPLPQGGNPPLPNSQNLPPAGPALPAELAKLLGSYGTQDTGSIVGDEDKPLDVAQIRKGDPDSLMVYTNINVLGTELIELAPGVKGIKPNVSRNIENIHDSSKKEIIRDLTGFISEDAVYAGDVIERAKILTLFRNAFLKYGSYDKIPNSIKDRLLSPSKDADSAIKNNLKSEYKWGSGKVKFVVSHNQKSLRRYNTVDPESTYLLLPQIVFEVENTDSSKPVLQITLADLHNNTTISDFSQQLLMDNGNSKLNKDREFSLDINNLESVLKSFSTGNRFHRSNKGSSVTRSLFDLYNDGGGYIISKPYIITRTKIGQDLYNESGIEIDQLGPGNPIVFVTTDPDLKFPGGGDVTADLLKTYYEAYRTQEAENEGKADEDKVHDYKPVVQWYKVNNRTINTTDPNSPAHNFRDYFERYFKILKLAGKDKSKLSQLDTYYDPYNSARMLMSIYAAYGAYNKASQDTAFPNRTKLQGPLGYLKSIVNRFSMIYGYVPEYNENGILIGVRTEPYKGMTYISPETTPKPDKISFVTPDGKNILPPKDCLTQFKQFFKDGSDKGYHDIMHTLAGLLVEKDADYGFDLFSPETLNNVYDMLGKVFTSNQRAYNPKTKSLVEIPETALFPKGIFLNPVMVSTVGDQQSYVREMYIDDDILKNFVLDVMPMGQSYILNTVELKRSLGITTPGGGLSTGGTKPSGSTSSGGGSSTNVDKWGTNSKVRFDLTTKPNVTNLKELGDFLNEKLQRSEMDLILKLLNKDSFIPNGISTNSIFSKIEDLTKSPFEQINEMLLNITDGYQIDAGGDSIEITYSAQINNNAVDIFRVAISRLHTLFDIIKDSLNDPNTEIKRNKNNFKIVQKDKFKFSLDFSNKKVDIELYEDDDQELIDYIDEIKSVYGGVFGKVKSLNEKLNKAFNEDTDINDITDIDSTFNTFINNLTLEDLTSENGDILILNYNNPKESKMFMDLLNDQVSINRSTYSNDIINILDIYNEGKTSVEFDGVVFDPNTKSFDITFKGYNFKIDSDYNLTISAPEISSEGLIELKGLTNEGQDGVIDPAVVELEFKNYKELIRQVFAGTTLLNPINSILGSSGNTTIDDVKQALNVKIQSLSDSDLYGKGGITFIQFDENNNFKNAFSVQALLLIYFDNNKSEVAKEVLELFNTNQNNINNIIDDLTFDKSTGTLDFSVKGYKVKIDKNLNVSLVKPAASQLLSSHDIKTTEIWANITQNLLPLFGKGNQAKASDLLNKIFINKNAEISDIRWLYNSIMRNQKDKFNVNFNKLLNIYCK